MGTEWTASEADMAARKSHAAAPSNPAVDTHVAALKAARADRPTFEAAIAAIEGGSTLNAADVCAIANTYGAGGTAAKSRKAALEKINRRFVEIVRATKNAKTAADTRLW